MLGAETASVSEDGMISFGGPDGCDFVAGRVVRKTDAIGVDICTAAACSLVSKDEAAVFVGHNVDVGQKRPLRRIENHDVADDVAFGVVNPCVDVVGAEKGIRDPDDCDVAIGQYDPFWFLLHRLQRRLVAVRPIREVR